MRKVLGRGIERKREVSGNDVVAQTLADLDARVEMIQALIALGLKAVEGELQAAVAQLAGRRYGRGPEGASTAEARSAARWSPTIGNSNRLVG